MRNARGVVTYVRGGPGEKRRTLATIARRIVLLENDPQGSRSVRPELPEAFLKEEEDVHEEQKFTLGAYLYIETIRIQKNEFLFRPEDSDNYVYIVQSGSIDVLNVDLKDTESDQPLVLKKVKQGEPIVSFLSLLEYMNPRRTGNGCYGYISAIATEESQVIKIPFETFKRAFDKHQDHLFRVVQIIMLRLQRVTLIAINQYLGLGTEFMNKLNRGREMTGTDFFEANSDNLRKEQVFAREKFCNFFEIDDQCDLLYPESILIVEFHEGASLVDENTAQDAYLALVMKGCFKISQKIDNISKELQKAYPGKALMESKAAVVHVSIVNKIMDKHPRASISLALSIIRYLSPFVRSIDFALEWILVESGKALYKQHDIADCIYVVLSGRLRSIISRTFQKEFVAEFGRGELTGIVETLTNTRRSSTVIAIRDTEVAKLPSGLINSIKLKYPIVLLRLINLLGKKLLRSWETGTRCQNELSFDDEVSSFSTVALIAITNGVPLSAFAYELTHSANFIGPTLRLTANIVKSELGVFALDRIRDFRLTNWLAQKEDQYNLVIFQCDKDITSWSQLCLRHADVVLLIVNPVNALSSGVSKFEERIDRLSKRTRKELIFIYPETVDYPEKTSQWLNKRAWINSHMHIRCPPRLYFKKKEFRVDEYYNKVVLPKAQVDIFSDFSRLARMLTGTSVGLVLGGGGARGCSHVGMIKAILESGIPIDRVAGVSIGALIGALYCQEKELAKFTVKARSFAEKINCRWKQALDLTYPFTAIFSGRAFNAMVQDSFNDRDIEDLWLPFFTITTDISTSAMRVHDYGSLWRYVRSSMSLAGYLPPLCDPHDGHLLLDGGYTNNLPADIMRSKGAQHIIAIDVGTQDEKNMTNYGDYLSGWQVLWRKWNPLLTALKVPDHTDIQSRLAYVSCVKQLECVRKSEYCDYIRPPIDEFKTMQFGAFEKIKDVGYKHGKTYFLGLKKSGRMHIFPLGNSQDEDCNLLSGRCNLPHHRNSILSHSSSVSQLESFEEFISKNASQHETSNETQEKEDDSSYPINDK
ncbi:NTE [Lepeophtheirus salmonis]|uniref:Neuropathy target esterase sws n=4 Tax=Lepeophtheirus salmonis TaxID=72036 RepID=A0A7R8H2N5_LEPSM|nr:NTE [Lepeophtheirus salmonis]CAF2829360.1 NTE [Lepeophtheirus salmonis]